MSEIYNARGLMEAAGMTYRQFDYWCSLGALRPLVVNGRANKGTGNHRLFAAAEVRVARLLAALANEGVGIEAAARAARDLEERGEARLGVFRLSVADGQAVVGDE